MRQLLILRSNVRNHFYHKQQQQQQQQQHSLLHRHRRSSSSSSSGAEADGHKTLTKTIYRQLLRWCASTGYEVPLSPLPPLHLTPPTVDAISLRALAQAYHHHHRERGNVNNNTNDGNERQVSSSSSSTQAALDMVRLLPRNAILNERKLTLTLHNAAQVRDVTRLIYRLNNLQKEGSDATERNRQRKERVSLGFEALRSLNQLTELLDERKEKRESHRDRTGVHYRVGQVIQHKSQRWRAVIAGWNRIPLPNPPHTTPSSKTSLTQKHYDDVSSTNTTNTTNNNDTVNTTPTTIEYILHIDEGDASFSETTRIIGSSKSLQNELEPVLDPQLRRLRNPFLAHTFEGFGNGRFRPGRVSRFEYPRDDDDDHDDDENDKPTKTPNLQDVQATIRLHEAAKLCIRDIQEISASLLRTARGTTTKTTTTTGTLPLLSDLEHRLVGILEGKVQNSADQLSEVEEGGGLTSSEKLAVRYLAAFMNVVFYVLEIMWQRRVSKWKKETIQFPLGTVVKHKRYNFRGIVVGWDSHPKTDVSRWDGLQGIDPNVLNETPFYHIIADRDDTARVFGKERPFRYVCEENLEVCPAGEDRELNVVMEEDMDGWVVEDGADGREVYVPPDEVKFRHAESLGNDEEYVNSRMEEITEEILTYLLRIKDTSSPSSELSINTLFHLLQNCANADDAFVVQETIKEIWKSHSDAEIRWRLDDGNSALMRGDKNKSLAIYDAILAEGAEEEGEVDREGCFEAWNKKATCHYLLGDLESSREAAEMAVSQNPRHFQALSGLGLVYYDMGKFRDSAEIFRRSLELDPWSRVSSRLSVCLDTLKRMDGDKGDGGLEENEMKDKGSGGHDTL